MIASLSATPRVWCTGTSSPCLSVFKPVSLEHDTVGGHATEHPSDALWWRHEALHRLVLVDYERRHAAFERERNELQTVAFAEDAHDRPSESWSQHATAIERWRSAAAEVVVPFSLDPFARWWSMRRL